MILGRFEAAEDPDTESCSACLSAAGLQNVGMAMRRPRRAAAANVFASGEMHQNDSAKNNLLP